MQVRIWTCTFSCIADDVFEFILIVSWELELLASVKPNCGTLRIVQL